MTWYKQEGELVPFTCWPWMRTTTQLSKDFPSDFNQIHSHFKKQYGWIYWDLNAMNKLAKSIYQKYGKDTTPIYNSFLTAAKALEQFYLDSFAEDLTTYHKTKLLKFYKQLWNLHTAMWKTSLFIDSFDPGFDQDTIEATAQKHSMSMEEAATLTTPTGLTYSSERKLQFLKLVLEQGSTLSWKHPLIQKHVRQFDYYQYSYAHVHHLTKEQIEQELHPNFITIQQEYALLSSYQQQQQQKIDIILKKYNLPENPLLFFQILTCWRDERKKYNMMGCHILHHILDALSNHTKISKQYLDYLNYDEVEEVLNGEITPQQLLERYKGTTTYIIERNGHQTLVGIKAQQKYQELEKQLCSATGSQIRGITACWGKAQGRVRIVIDREDFAKFKEGDILVAGMTRPEHLPLMKKAAAIVTDEGGITCHAAIISRELKIPCIIGTKIATKLLKNGDLVEVKANHGLVVIRG